MLQLQGAGAIYRASQVILGRRAPDGRPARNLGLTGAVVALRGRRNWRAGLAGQRKQRRGRGRVRAQAVSERGRRSRGLKRRGERLAGPGWERGALGLAGSLGRGAGAGLGGGKRAARGRGKKGAGPRASRAERGRKKRVGRRVGLLGCLVGLGPVGIFLVSFSFSISFVFLFQTPLILF